MLSNNLGMECQDVVKITGIAQSCMQKSICVLMKISQNYGFAPGTRSAIGFGIAT